MSCINREEAIRLIMEYQGGAMDKPTARKVLEGMDGIEICKDTISRQAAISEIVGMTTMGVEELVIAGDKEKYDWIKGLSDSLVKIINLPSAQPEPQWIPCSERLPKDDTEVFVYLFDRKSPYIAWVRDGCWFTEEFQVEKENYPKEWMPLSEPYKEENRWQN